MAKTNAERQADHRAKYKSEKYRINTYISGEAKATLDGMARLMRMTQAQLLENLLRDYNRHVVPKLSAEQLDLFYDNDKRV